jgi:hypothetical protein
MHVVNPRLANQTTISFKHEVLAVVVVAHIFFVQNFIKKIKDHYF